MTARKENHKLDNRNITNFAQPEEQNITYIMLSSKDSFNTLNQRNTKHFKPLQQK